jgi:ABC-type nitrate/sulfonate/bicarbonate transport system permease component
MATLEDVKASAAAPSGFSAALDRVGGRAAGVVSFVAFVALWQLIVWGTGINPILLPSPASVFAQFIEVARIGLLVPAVLESLRGLAIGLSVALAVGIIAGLVIGASSWLQILTGPYLWALFATPRLALLPLIVLWLGFGLETKILMVFLSAVLPVTLSCKEGVQTVDESLLRAARSFGAGRMDLFKHVVIPFTLPFIANAVRNGISRGFVGLLIVEMRVSAGGIGTQVMRAMRSFNTARMFAFVAVLIITALTLITLSRMFETRVSRWREEVYL